MASTDSNSDRRMPILRRGMEQGATNHNKTWEFHLKARIEVIYLGVIIVR